MNTYQPYTYLIGWSDLNLWYYGARYASGCHPTDLWVSYFTSSKIVAERRKIYGEPDIILVDQTFDSAESALDHEKKVLKEQDAAKSSQWLNKNNGIGTWAAITVNTRQKMSEAAKSRPPREWTEESKRKASATRRGRKRTQDECLAISNGRKGKSSGPQSAATRSKRSESLKGRKRTVAECQAISAGLRKRNSAISKER